MLFVFSPIFVADTKITVVYNFVAPLSALGYLKEVFMLRKVSQSNFFHNTYRCKLGVL